MKGRFKYGVLEVRFGEYREHLVDGDSDITRYVITKLMDTLEEARERAKKRASIPHPYAIVRVRDDIEEKNRGAIRRCKYGLLLTRFGSMSSSILDNGYDEGSFIIEHMFNTLDGADKSRDRGISSGVVKVWPYLEDYEDTIMFEEDEYKRLKDRMFSNHIAKHIESGRSLRDISSVII